MKHFVWYLFIIGFGEVFITYLVNVKHIKTTVYSNVLNVFILVFNAYIFNHFIQNNTIKNIINTIVGVFVLWWLYSNISSGTFNIFNFLFFVVAAFIQIIITLLYFYWFLKSDTNGNLVFLKAGFIIATGIFIFNLGAVINFSVANSIQQHHLQLLGVPLNYQIPRLLCIPLYTCISIALLKWKKYPQTTFLK